jgi:hypothetical protein
MAERAMPAPAIAARADPKESFFCVSILIWLFPAGFVFARKREGRNPKEPPGSKISTLAHTTNAVSS